MGKVGGWILGIGVGILGTYGIWTHTGRSCQAPTLPKEITFHLVDTPSTRGYLVGMQPYMVPSDYSCEESFFAKLDTYFRKAQERGLLMRKSIVLLPEYVGTWLVLAGEKASLYEQKNLERGLMGLVLSNPVGYLGAYLRSPDVKDKSAAAAFLYKGPLMARIYHRVFSRLARQYKVTVVAGSIVLPDPIIEYDSLVTRWGPLYNVSVVYDTLGRPYSDLVKKVYPIETELAFTARGNVSDLPIFSTPAGRLGVLICADSWYPDTYQALKGAEVVGVLSYLMGTDCWQKSWRGYSGFPSPNDVAKEESEGLSEGEAWLRYALGGRLKYLPTAKIGLNVFLQGDFWELGADGYPIMATPTASEQLPRADIIGVGL
ncbi:MAG: nitrilase-related carbon-nitrogen hydrolase [Bacteroidia bacterium]